MSYTPTVWKTGDVISSANLNKLENGVAAKQDALTFDNSPTANSTNPVTSGGVATALAAKQDQLTVDPTPIASSTNPVSSGGVYTAIDNVASKEVTVSGTAPTITAAENTRYICGEVVSLSFTPSSSGVSEVIFTAGSTVPVVTLPSTVKMPEWYEIEANHVYEISVLNGVYGAVMSWAV